MILGLKQCQKTFWFKALMLLVFISLYKAPLYAQLNASFLVNNASGCSPLNVQFNNTSTGAVSYFWDFGDGNTSILTNPSDIYPNTGSYTVKLVAYSANGQADSLILSNAVNVIQQPIPLFVANLTHVCFDNNTIQFTNLSTNYDSCLWDFGDGSTSSLVNISHAYTSPGIYTVTLVCFNTVAGCSESFTRNQYITIEASPVVTVGVNVNSTCDPNQVFNFTAFSSNAISFFWDFGDNTTSLLQNPNHNYSQPGTYSVTLVTTSLGGCVDTLLLTDYVEVKNNPVPSIFISDSSGCLPFWVNYYTNGTFASSLWTFGDGDSSSGLGGYHPYLTAGNFTITANLTYANGCSNSISCNNIQAFSTPNAAITLVNYEGCGPLSVQCLNNSSNGNTYLWDFGDGSTSTAFSPSHTYLSNGWFLVRLTVTNANGCSTVSAPATVKVKGPGATIYSDVTSGCPPLTVNFIGNPISQTAYFWDFGDGTTSILANPQHVYSNLGNYTVKLAVTNIWGCTDTVVNPLLINVATPVTNFIAPAAITGCAPMKVTLSDNTPGATSWLWDFGDGNTGNGQNISHTYTSPGTYIVTLNTTSPNGGCAQTINNFSTFIIGGGIPDFSYTQSLCPPYTAYFQDSSINAVSWLWNFGDGNTSTLQNPNHVYADPGVYNVSLTITTADGCQLTVMHNYALNFSPLVSNATAFTTDTVLPLTVNFAANTTGATWWLWNFGDSTTSTLENPIHIYTVPGPYTISLIIGNDSCSLTYNYPPTALGVGSGGSLGDPDSIHSPQPFSGCSPVGVNFHNPFINTISWTWNFGDGNTSTLANPSHTYTIPGTYDISLYAIRANGILDSLIQPGSVIVTGGTNADFTILHSNSCTGNTVSLWVVDSGISTYLWNFGDGTSSTLANPVHTYPNNGSNYIISLYVSDSSGCTDFMSKSFYASPANPLHASKKKACGGDSIFFDCGSLLYSTYVWHFGDGDSSLLPFTYHQYNDSGIYYVTLTVTDTSGCSQTLSLSDPVQIFDPEPFFTMVFSQHCVGLDVTFTNLSSNADAYYWDFGDGTYTSTANPTHLYTNPGNYQVSLTAIKNNCSKTYTLSNAFYVPNTTIDFNYLQDKECFPISIICNDLSTDVVSWLWDFGDGDTSTAQNPVHTYLQVPFGDIELTVKNANGCRLKKTLPKIKATIATFALNDSTGCSPLSISFNDSSINASTYQWSFGDGNVSNQANPTHVYMQSGYYDVQLIVQAASGCRDTLKVDSLIQVSSLSVNFSSNENAACAPAIIDFTDLSVNATSWNWYFGDGSSSQLKNPSHIYSIPGLYDVLLVVSNGDGCIDSLLYPGMIRVNGPITGFTVSDTIGCGQVSVVFTDTSFNAFTWQWSFGDGSSSGTMNPQHTYTNPGQYSASLITEDSLGCQSVFNYPFNITVNAIPVASFTISDTIGCSTLNVLFNNYSSDYDSLLWVFGDGNTLINDSSTTYNYTVSGIYYPYLIAFATAGCADTFYLNQAVKIIQQPFADFTAGTVRGCAPLTTGFNNLSSNTSGNSTFFWEFGNGDTSNLPNPNYTYLVPGNYTVTLTVSNGSMCYNSAVKTAYIQVYDNNPPPANSILRVSVLDNSRVEINWENSAVPDLGSYELYKLNPLNNKFEPLFIDLNPNNATINLVTTYIDTLLNTLTETYTYKLRTVDLCDNGLPLDSLNSHTTINLSAQTQGKNINLTWTPYKGCVINQYELYRNDPATGNYLKIANVSPTASSYLDSGLVCPELYGYRVTATDLCGNTYSSESDTAIAKPENSLNGQQVEVMRTTVIDDENTLTEWKAPLLAPDQVVAYSIYRSELESGNYTLLGNVGPNVFNFLDNHADVHHQNYFYKIEVVNRCNAETLLSNIGSSILLLADPDNNTTRLIWTAYKGWDTGVSRYIIERQNANGVWETIKVVDGNTLQTEDK